MWSELKRFAALPPARRRLLAEALLALALARGGNGDSSFPADCSLAGNAGNGKSGDGH